MKTKKILAVVLAAVMVFALAACGQNETEPVAEEEEVKIVGGWTRAEDMSITEEIQQLTDAVADVVSGTTYTPVAYLGSQVVAGTNHAILCAELQATADAVPTYAIVVIYEDLEGNAEILESYSSEAEVQFMSVGDLVGGWTPSASLEPTEAAKTAMEKATEQIAGAEYKPVALLAEQLVSGMNYCMLCEVKEEYPDAVPEMMIVNVYADLQGNAQITDAYEFEGGFAFAEALPAESLEQIPMPDGNIENAPEGMPEGKPEGAPEGMPAGVSGERPDGMPGEKPEDMPEPPEMDGEQTSAGETVTVYRADGTELTATVNEDGAYAMEDGSLYLLGEDGVLRAEGLEDLFLAVPEE